MLTSMLSRWRASVIGRLFSSHMASKDQCQVGRPGRGARNDPEVTAGYLRELMGRALSTPTVEAILEFSAFATRMHRLGAYNIYMVFAQRPGARAIASRREWEDAGQQVRPDAIPILILQPRGPITQVFELADTLPLRDKDPREDAFAATGEFEATTLEKLIGSLAGSPKKALKVDVVLEDFGADQAGQIARQLPLRQGGVVLNQPGGAILNRDDRPGGWRIKLNRRLTAPEQFATLVHELGHLFCGHVGGFQEIDPKRDETGWPNRSHLPLATKEIEAELVAWHICERRGLVTGSALYLRPHLERAGHAVGAVDLDRVIRAIAKVENHLPARTRARR